MSRDNNERKVRKARALFLEWLKDDTPVGFEEKYGWEAASVIYRRIRFSPNSRNTAAYMKVQDRRRAKRELEREVLGPFVCTRKGSEADACRYGGETYEDQWVDWDWYIHGGNYQEDDDFDAEAERWEDLDWVLNHDEYGDICDTHYHDGLTQMIDEEGYAHYWGHILSHSNTKPQGFSKGVSLGELLRSRLI